MILLIQYLDDCKLISCHLINHILIITWKTGDYLSLKAVFTHHPITVSHLQIPQSYRFYHHKACITHHKACITNISTLISVNDTKYICM